MASLVLASPTMAIRSECFGHACPGFEVALVDTRKAKDFRTISVHRNNADSDQVILVESRETGEGCDSHIAWRMSCGRRANFLALLDDEPLLDFWLTRLTKTAAEPFLQHRRVPNCAGRHGVSHND